MPPPRSPTRSQRILDQLNGRGPPRAKLPAIIVALILGSALVLVVFMLEQGSP